MDYRLLNQFLGKHGHSTTRQRRTIFGQLYSNDPLTIAEIIKLNQGSIDRVSIYRTIDLFEKLGIVLRINSGRKTRIELGDQFSAHHHHLTCLKCNKVIKLSEDRLEEFIKEIAQENSFYPTTHQVEIQGWCMNCRRSSLVFTRVGLTTVS